MVPRRFVLILVACGLLLTTTAAPTFAKKPNPPAVGERPLTGVEQADSDHKVAAAEAYVAGVRDAGGDVVSLACVTPLGTVTTEEATTQTLAATADATTSAAGAVALACSVPQGFLAMEARDQIFNHYCGPATGQVITNYAWAAAAGGNVFTQQRIAGWMRTDINGGTDAFSLEVGLETGTRGAPRRPANWNWLVTNLLDSDRDGTTADQLQDYVRANVSGSKMPLAIAVKPHDPNSAFNLASWPRAVRSPGHWIAVYGWVGLFNGNDAARIYYTDSSRDEGGATGKFWNPTRHVAAMIGEHTKRIVW